MGGQYTAEEIQEAFWNYDDDKTFTLTIDELRKIVCEEGDEMNDVRFSLMFLLLSFLHPHSFVHSCQ